MELLSQLWAIGIAAELVPRSHPSLSEQYEYAHTRGIKWLVILDDKTLGPGQTVRVKTLDRKGEDIPVYDVARFLQVALSGAQDPGRSYAAVWGQAGGPGGSAIGAGGMSGGGGVSGAGPGVSLRVLQRSHSSADVGKSSLDGGDEGESVRESVRDARERDKERHAGRRGNTRY